MRKARELTDEEIAQELTELQAKWDDFRANLDEGHGGSPGEWMVERMDELATEQERRGCSRGGIRRTSLDELATAV